MTDNSDRSERYSMEYGPTARNLMESRSAESHAEFFLPYLREGIDVLDCGCGPGTISVKIAEMVTPGKFVGIDPSEGHF